MNRISLLWFILSLNLCESVKLPSEIIDLSRWGLTLPVNASTVIYQPRLAEYSLPPYFFTNDNETGVIFRAHCGGDTVTATGYPRSDLRETTADGRTKASWNTTSGIHILTLSARINSIPSKIPEMSCIQIRNTTTDALQIRLHSDYLGVESNNVPLGNVDVSYKLRTPFVIQLRVEEGSARIYYNNQLKVVYPLNSTDCRFMAGAYTLSTVSRGDTSDAYSEIEIYSLKVEHYDSRANETASSEDSSTENPNASTISTVESSVNTASIDEGKVDPQATDSDGNVAALAGGIAGGVFAICLLLAIVIIIFIRKKKRPRTDTARGDLELANYEGIPLSGAEYQALPSKLPNNTGISSVVSKASDWSIPYSEIILEKEVGRGAFGVVYKAKWRSAPVAVKKMLVETMVKKQVEDFHTEILLMKNLRPAPNVVTLIGICEEPLCLVTEFCEKGSLWSLLESEQRISESAINKIILGMARGMLHLHMESIIHRDLAARNVLLSSSFEAKISDFGLSRVAEDGSGKTQNAIGPLRWMAPESLSSQIYSFASDVWSFGVTLIEIYTRKAPYDEMDALNAASRVMRGELIPQIPTNAPLHIAQILESIFVMDPNARPTFQYICEVLETINREK